ncbi:MAG TPA: FAD-dependent oxidoreductase [Geminicoccaceae bacterium]|nr:FAD-dependent oxidoreductase [Geminicoccus sp.]HMU51477.1 FAD-dependent oxidoreductase [Geminicoccaceae bacterium]
MRTHARVAVIGGGVVGCSVLYHLTRTGWSDVVLVERAELTSGSTWHAAGGMHTLNSDPNVARLQTYTIQLYEELERISGQSCGIHLNGGLMLAGTPERMDYLRHAHAKGRYLGMKTELISAAEARRRFPLMDERHFVGALYDEVEGHVDPYGVTHAYAKAARMAGAEIVLRNRVTGLLARPEGGWEVVTEQGSIVAEHVVNAGGLWAREVGRMVGLELPVLAMEHQYLITDDMPELAGRPELLHVIDFEGEIYLRQEGQGVLLGTYEKAAKPWSPDTTPWDFATELLPEDIERIAPSLEVGFRHFPAIERAGIRKIVNGPFTFAPDGNPLVGPVRGLRNFWCACGVMAGFSQGGGVGLALANWMTQGDPGFDVWAMDVARYGQWVTPAYTQAKVRENYSRRFSISFPNEELPAARPLRTTAAYDRLRERNAVFGASYGLEHALWFAPDGEQPVEEPTFKRSNAFAAVAGECRAVREAVGLLEISNFAKYEVTGDGAVAWLARVMAGRIPAPGRMALTPMLDPAGRLIGDFTLARRADRFLVLGSGIAEEYHLRWWESQLPASGVGLRSLSAELTGFALAGPRSRELLAGLTRADLSTAAFPFLSFAPMTIGMVPALVGRVSYTGDLGYEIWVAPDWLRTLHDTLVEAGKPLGLRHFGARALNSLRLEKGFGSWAREFRPIYTASEAGLDGFVAWKRGGFIGAEAAAAARSPERRRVTLVIDDAGVDCMGDEPIWHGGEVVGWITSGGWAHWVQRSLAQGYVPTALAAAQDLEVEILGERRPARVSPRPLFDPDGRRMRD